MKKLFIVLALAASGIMIACGNSNTPTTTTPPAESSTPVATETPKIAAVEVPAEINELLNKNTCLTCHAANEKIVGPAYVEVARRNYTVDEIVGYIYKPKPENWPDYPPMAALPNVPKEDAKKIAEWIVSLK